MLHIWLMDFLQPMDLDQPRYPQKARENIFWLGPQFPSHLNIEKLD